MIYSKEVAEAVVAPLVACPATAAVVGSLVVGRVATFLMRSQTVSAAGRSVFVTGCDTGFGRRLAVSLASQRVKVFAGCLQEKSVAELTALGVRAFIMDVTSAEDIAKATQIVADECGDEGLWGVVNNAGIGNGGPLELFSVDDFRLTIEINLIAVHAVTKALLPYIQKAQGRVVNVASVAGRFSGPGMCAYSASKHGVEALSDALRVEAKAWNVSVSIIEPGFFATQIIDPKALEKGMQRSWAQVSPEVKAKYGESYLPDTHQATVPSLEKFASTDLSLVTNAMERALFARYPLTRYLVGTDAHLMWMPVARLPTFMKDALLYAMHAKVTPQFLKENPLRRPWSLEAKVIFLTLSVLLLIYAALTYDCACLYT